MLQLEGLHLADAPARAWALLAMAARGLGALAWPQPAFAAAAAPRLRAGREPPAPAPAAARGAWPGAAAGAAPRRPRGAAAATAAGCALAGGARGRPGAPPRGPCRRAAAARSPGPRRRRPSAGGRGAGAGGAGGAAAAASFAGVLHGLRCARAAERREILAKESDKGLEMIAVGLRLKRRGKKQRDELMALIEETLAHDETVFENRQDLRKLAQVIGRLPDPSEATKFIIGQKKITVEKLKQWCKELRLPVTGRRAVLAEQFTQELLEIRKVMNSSSASSTASPAEPFVQETGSRQAGHQSGARASEEATSRPEDEHARYTSPGAEALSTGAAAPAPGNDVLQVNDAELAANDEVAVAEPVPFVDATPVSGYEHQEDASGWASPDQDVQTEGASAPQPVVAEAFTAPSVHQEFASPAQEYAPSDDGGDWRRQDAEVAWVDSGAPTGPDVRHDGGNYVQHDGGDYVQHDGGDYVQHGGDDYYGGPPASVQPEVSVVETATIADAAEVKNHARERRKAERRMKLMGYLVEEVAGIYGGEKDRYMADMKKMLKEVPDEARMAYCSDKFEEPTPALVNQRVPSVLGDMTEAPEFGAWHSEPHEYQMHMIGEIGPSRQAWCRWWDGTTGCGELVDLIDNNPVAVVSAALSTGANVPPRLKYLRQGEFVEYRRVDRAGGLTARAVLVRGIKGWPLMCEVETDRVLQE